MGKRGRGADGAEAGTRKGRRGRMRRILGLTAIVGAGALWRRRQQQRDGDEGLWGDPEVR